MDLNKLTMGRSAGEMGLQTAWWGDLEGRKQTWSAVKQSAVRLAASEMRRRKTKASRHPRWPRKAEGLELRAEPNQWGSNHVRGLLCGGGVAERERAVRGV